MRESIRAFSNVCALLSGDVSGRSREKDASIDGVPLRTYFLHIGKKQHPEAVFSRKGCYHAPSAEGVLPSPPDRSGERRRFCPADCSSACVSRRLLRTRAACGREGPAERSDSICPEGESMSSAYNKEMFHQYSMSTVMEEAQRCLLCYDAPCSRACPAETDPARFIRSVRFRNLKGAAETITENNALGAVCARVCPTEHYCQKGCTRSGIDRPIDGRSGHEAQPYRQARGKGDLMNRRSFAWSSGNRPALHDLDVFRQSHRSAGLGRIRGLHRVLRRAEERPARPSCAPRLRCQRYAVRLWLPVSREVLPG